MTTAIDREHNGTTLASDDVEIIDEIDPDNPSLDAPRARELTRQIRVALEHSYTLIITGVSGESVGCYGIQIVGCVLPG